MTESFFQHDKCDRNLSATVTFADSIDDCGFLAPVTAGMLTGLDHVSLTYQTTAPIKLMLVVSGSTATYDVLLNNCGPVVQKRQHSAFRVPEGQCGIRRCPSHGEDFRHRNRPAECCKGAGEILNYQPDLLCRDDLGDAAKCSSFGWIRARAHDKQVACAQRCGRRQNIPWKFFPLMENWPGLFLDSKGWSKQGSDSARSCQGTVCCEGD